MEKELFIELVKNIKTEVPGATIVAHVSGRTGKFMLEFREYAAIDDEKVLIVYGGLPTSIELKSIHSLDFHPDNTK